MFWDHGKCRWRDGVSRPHGTHGRGSRNESEFRRDERWKGDGTTATGQKPTGLTSDGTVADGRGGRKGHHFSVERVEQLREKCLARAARRWLNVKKSLRAAAHETSNQRLFIKKQEVVSSWEVRRMSDALPVVTVLLTFSTSKDKINKWGVGGWGGEKTGLIRAWLMRMGVCARSLPWW